MQLHTMLKSALLASFGAVSMAAQAFAEEPRPINVPAGDLIVALKTFTKQTGVEVVYLSNRLMGLKTHGVSGTLLPQDALTKMLEGTPLALKVDPSGAVLITLPGEDLDSGAPAKSSGLTSAGAGFHLARSGTDSMQGVAASGATQAGEKNDPVGAEAASQDRIQEVIVTAQKRSERLIDVPISIVAMGADELQKRRIDSIDTLSMSVPGVAIQNNGGYYRLITIRGVSNFFGTASLIGMYLDEASVTSSVPSYQLDLRAYDLERVEVLRGPQGTLYGEGSAGGTIRFITRNPELDRFAMKADVAAQFTEGGAPGQSVQGALNVPLVENKLGLRVAGTFDHQGGWIDQPAAGRKDYNEQNLTNVRAKGLWQPTSQLTVNAMAVVHRNDGSYNGGEDADGNYTQAFGLTTTPAVEDDYEIYNLTLSYDFAWARLLSTTSYTNQDKDIAHMGQRRQYTAPPTPQTHIYYGDYALDADSVTEELRLTSLGSGRWQWTIGGYYQRARNETFAEYLFSLPPPTGSPLPAPFEFLSANESKAWAAFGDASYKLTNRLTLGAGLRYYEDDKNSASGFAIGVPPVLGPQLNGKFHSLNPRAYAQFKLTDQINTYASIAKGFRSGGFNALNQPSYDPESVITYELGTKMSLMQGRVSTDLALFHSDYEDYQIVGTIVAPSGQLLNITSNVGDARIRGVEWGVSWHPTDQWTLSLNGDRLQAEFTEIKANPRSHNVGDPLDAFPKYTYTASVQRDYSLFGKSGFARLDYNEQSRMYYRIRYYGPWYHSQSDIINMLNVNFGLQWNESLSFGVFGQNLLDDRGFITAENIQQSAPRARPRTYGIQFSLDF